MIKEELVSKIANDTGFRRVVVAEVINQMIANVTAALENGDKVQVIMLDDSIAPGSNVR